MLTSVRLCSHVFNNHLLTTTFTLTNLPLSCMLTYLITYLLTYSDTVLLEKLIGFAANQEIPRILWNPKVHYRTHKRNIM